MLLPDGYTYLDIGEKSLENVMPWDTVKALEFRRWTPSLGGPLRELQAKSRARVDSSPYFRRVEGFLKRQEAFRKRKSMPIQLKKFFEERNRSREESEALEALQKQATDLGVDPLTGTQAAAADSVEAEKLKNWKEQLSRDFYLREAADVLSDLALFYTAKR
jgi:carboxyl-terminal processing protease